MNADLSAVTQVILHKHKHTSGFKLLILGSGILLTTSVLAACMYLYARQLSADDSSVYAQHRNHRSLRTAVR